MVHPHVQTHRYIAIGATSDAGKSDAPGAPLRRLLAWHGQLWQGEAPARAVRRLPSGGRKMAAIRRRFKAEHWAKTGPRQCADLGAKGGAARLKQRASQRTARSAHASRPPRAPREPRPLCSRTAANHNERGRKNITQFGEVKMFSKGQMQPVLPVPPPRRAMAKGLARILTKATTHTLPESTPPFSCVRRPPRLPCCKQVRTYLAAPAPPSPECPADALRIVASYC